MAFNPFKFAAGAFATVLGLVPGNPLKYQFITLGLALAGESLGLGGGVGKGGTRRHKSSFSGNTSSADRGVPVAYGSTRLGAIVVDYRVLQSGQNEDLYIPAVFCHGSRDNLGIAEIGAITFDDRSAFNSSAVAQTPFTATNAKVAKLLGTSTQTVVDESINSTTLATVTADWTSTDDGRGLAVGLFFCQRDDDAYSGLPKIIADIKGNFVEDTRSAVVVNCSFTSTTITRASGSWVTDGYVALDRVAITGTASNNSTFTTSNVTATVLTVTGGSTEGTVEATGARWAHPDNGGDNPPMVIRDYLMSTIYGASVPLASIDSTSFEAAADYCDVSVTVPDDAGGSTTQNRFRCAGWVNTDQSIERNLSELLSSCRGNLVFEAGVYRLVITQAKKPSSVKLDKSNIVGDWEFGSDGIQNRYNMAEATFIDPAQRYLPEVVRWPKQGASNSFLTSDNSFVSQVQSSLPFTQSLHMAEQILMTQIKESRQGIKVGLTCTEEALQYQVGDIVPISHASPGWGTRWLTGVSLTFTTPEIITRASGDFTADGWTVGPVEIVGSALSDGVYIITTVGTSTITLDSRWVLPDSTAGSGITLNNPKLFNVDSLGISQGGGTAPPLVRLALSEYDISVYDHDSQADADAAPDTDLHDPFVIAAPTSLVLTADRTASLMTFDADMIPRIKIAWTDSTSPFVSYYEVELKQSTESTYIQIPNVLPGIAETFAEANGGRNAAVTWNVRVRAVSVTNVRSAWLSGNGSVDADNYYDNPRTNWTTIVTSVDSPYTFTTSDIMVYSTPDNGTMVCTLPAITTAWIGRVIKITQVDPVASWRTSVVATGADTLNGSASPTAITMSGDNSAIRIICIDTSSWLTF